MNRISRENLLQEDLLTYHPNKWHVHLPFINYSVRLEDFIPALAGGIGKISLVAAFAAAWANGLHIRDASFITENVRLELIIGGLFTLLLCAVFNPASAPPGTLAPLVPLIPSIISAGIHPLPLSLLIGIIGVMISSINGFKRIIRLNGQGTIGGIILLFGIMGLTSSLNELRSWTTEIRKPHLFSLLLFGGICIYTFLNKKKMKYLTIPLCAVLALLVSGLLGIFPSLDTTLSLPILNPNEWWHEKWGIGFGLTAQNFIKALPFALLAVVMWPIDALAIKTMQEENYPKEATDAVFNMDDTYIIVSIRNMVGSLMGGAQIASLWRSFMIPLASVKRPIGGSAFLLGIIGILFGILGFPIDIAVFPPLLWLVLIVGIYIPLLEVGFSRLTTSVHIQTAVVCILAGLAISPIIGWITGMLIENFNLSHAKNHNRVLSSQDKTLTLLLVVIVLCTFFYTNLIT